MTNVPIIAYHYPWTPCELNEQQRCTKNHLTYQWFASTSCDNDSTNQIEFHEGQLYLETKTIEKYRPCFNFAS